MKKGESRRCLVPYKGCDDICCAYCTRKNCPAPYSKCRDNPDECGYSVPDYGVRPESTTYSKGRKKRAMQVNFNDFGM